jgi:putative two-component system response regulator
MLGSHIWRVEPALRYCNIALHYCNIDGEVESLQKGEKTMPNALDSADKATILVVDDSPDTRNLVIALLEGDYKMLAANNGEAALKLAQSDTPPDLIMLDVMMPGMSGYDVCRQLRENPLTRDIPVIFVTAMTGEGNELQGRALGAVGFLSKPLDLRNVVTQVKGYFALQKKHRELESLKK